MFAVSRFRFAVAAAAAESTSTTTTSASTTSDTTTNENNNAALAQSTSSSQSSSNSVKIHGDKIGNRFAEKPRQHTPRWVLNEAAEHHNGWGVYKTRKQVIEVLQAVRVSKPVWWCSACDDVLARMINLRQQMNWGSTAQERGAIIVIEGLDGVGKSTVTEALASEFAIEDEINLSDQNFGLDGEDGQDKFDKESTPSFASGIGNTNSFFASARSGDYVGKDHRESAKNFTTKNEKGTNKNKNNSTIEIKNTEMLVKAIVTQQKRRKALETVIPGALLLRTPDPCLDTARAKFRVMEEPIARAFYCAANYITADAVIRHSMEGRVVVLDRWWNSTCAMGLAARSHALSNLTIKQEQQRIEDMLRKRELKEKNRQERQHILKEQEEEAEKNREKSSPEILAKKATEMAKLVRNVVVPGGAYFFNNNINDKEKAPSSVWSRLFGKSSLKQQEIEKVEDLEMTRDMMMNPPEVLEKQLMFDLLPPPDCKIYQWPADLPPVDLRILLDVSEDIRTKRMAKRGDENQEEKVLAEKRALRETAMEAYRRMTPELKTVQVPNYASAVNEIVSMIEESKELRKLMPKGMPKKYPQAVVDSIAPY